VIDDIVTHAVLMIWAFPGEESSAQCIGLSSSATSLPRKLPDADHSKHRTADCGRQKNQPPTDAGADEHASSRTFIAGLS
jgi:hypothetical protein